MKKSIGNLYAILENGNSSSGTLGLVNSNDKKISIEFVLYTPEFGPSGIAINKNIYKLIVFGDFVNKSQIAISEITGIPRLANLSESVEGISNRIFVGQELLVTYENKPIGSGVEYGPTYGLTYDENLTEMENDISVKVIDVISDGVFTYIDVISQSHLYWISDGGSKIVLNNVRRLTNNVNKNYPKNIHITNLITNKSTNESSVDLKFTKVTENVEKFKVAYRRKTIDGNTDWYFIDNVLNESCKLIGLDYNENYEVRVMSYFEDDSSIFSPSITFKTI